MGKNRDIKSVVALLSNKIVHEIVARHTNRPESKHFLEAEAAEYRDQTEKAFDWYHWNEQDKENIKKDAIKEVKKIMFSKYPDVFFDEKETEHYVKEEIKELEL